MKAGVCIPREKGMMEKDNLPTEEGRLGPRGLPRVSLRQNKSMERWHKEN